MTRDVEIVSWNQITIVTKHLFLEVQLGHDSGVKKRALELSLQFSKREITHELMPSCVGDDNSLQQASKSTDATVIKFVIHKEQYLRLPVLLFNLLVPQRSQRHVI